MAQDRSFLPPSNQRFPTTDVYDQGNKPGDGPLRIGGVDVDAMPQRTANLPSTLSASAKKQATALTMCRDLAAGPERIKEVSTTYLPKAPGEDAQNYMSRLARAVFFNVFAHTITGLVGQVFRRDPRVGDDVAPVILAQLENVDLEGTHFDVFARALLQDALTAGHAAVLVEFPQTDGTQSLKEEQSVTRPYWVPILKDNILSWRTTSENGHQVLTQLVIKETKMVADGLFGDREQVRYRVFSRAGGVVGFQLLEITEDDRVVLVSEGTYPTQTEIPVAEITTSGSTGMFESKPPLLDLAYLNIAHYQQYSDYATSIHKTCVPLLVRVGGNPDDDDQPFVAGPNALVDVPEGADLKYVSHSGQALAECKTSLEDLKSDMGTLGLAMLAPSKRSAETYQAKALDKSTEDAALAVAARGLEDGIERCLQFHANYLPLSNGAAVSGGSVAINRQFDQQSMQADMLTAWSGAVTAGIPARLMLDAMQAGELIDPDEDLDAIVQEMEAQAAAEAEQKAMDAAHSLEMLKARGTSPTTDPTTGSAKPVGVPTEGAA